MNDPIYDLYLGEMEALEQFRLRYAEAHPGVPIERDDPDTRRLIEVMAWLSARNREAARHNIFAMHRRLFSQSFPYLVAPLPACTLVQALGGEALVEPLQLAAGSELLASTPEGEEAVFTTLWAARVLPLKYTRLLLRHRSNGELRLLLQFETERLPIGEEVGWIPLYLHHLSDYQASLELLSQLKRNLLRAKVMFGTRLSPIDLVDSEVGLPCEVQFGVPPSPRGEGLPSTNPVQEVRMRLHFPEQGLFVSFKIPGWEPPADERFSTRWGFVVALDLRPEWPAELEPSFASFLPGVVPVVNRVKGSAEPIRDDGTSSRHPIRYGGGSTSFDLLEVQGVHLASARGLMPLRLGLLHGDPGTYEVEEIVREGRSPSHSLVRHNPAAFLGSELLMVDAWWYQPGFSRYLMRQLRWRGWRMHLPSVEFTAVGRPKRHLAPDHRDHLEIFVRTLGLRLKSRLDVHDVRSLVSMLGCVHESHFAALPGLFESVEVEELIPTRHSLRHLRLLYRIRLSARFEARNQFLLMEFLEQVEKLLDAWLVGAAVEVEAHVPALKSVLRPSDRRAA